MIKSRRFVGITSIMVVFLLACMLIACSNDALSDESSEEKTEASEVRVETELKFIIDEELDEALTELQALYSQEHKEVGFTENEYVFPEESSISDIAKTRKGAFANDPVNRDAGALNESEDESLSIADIFISSSQESMDELEDLELIDLSTRFDLLITELVIIAKSDFDLESIEWNDIVSEGYRVALADEATSEGVATRQAFSTIGAYLDPSGGVGLSISGTGGEYNGITPVIGGSFEELCELLEKEDADLSVVYASDAARQEGIKVVCNVPSSTYRMSLYPAAMSLDSRYPEEVEAFLVWATSDEEALEVWHKYGLTLLG